MEESIRLELGDWRFNAGILGFCNILQHADDKFSIGLNYIEFKAEVLDGFEEKYFSYLIDSYEEITHWDRFKKFYLNLKEHRNDDFQSFSEKDLEILNNMVVELKNYFKRPNYTKVYEFIASDHDIVSLEKELKQCKLAKGEKVEDIKENLKSIFYDLEKIYEFVYSKDGKKYLFAKTLIYNIINQSWEGVCFLNRNTKENDIYLDYKTIFVDRTREYLKEDKEKFKLTCFTTGLPIKNKSSSYDMGFLKDTGFDTNRKTSNVWNFYNDIYICDLARLIYSCIPCGMFFATNEDGIFVNSNQSVQELIRVNNNIKQSIKQSVREGQTNRNLHTYKALIKSIQKDTHSRIEYELADVQVIRKEKGRYRFNLLSQDIIHTIKSSKIELDSIIPSGYREGREYYYIYPIVIDRIMNGINMFTLVHKLLINKLTRSDSINNFYNISSVNALNRINLNFMGGVIGLNSEEKKEIVKKANRDGWYLGQEYRKGSNPEKVKGISYRLLNALKTRNSEGFLHNLLNSYMYVGKQVPKGIVEVLEDEDKLGVIGYAFVTGMVSSALSEGVNSDNNKGEK